MKKQKVTSREYKVMLNPEKFKGNENELRHHAQAFWDTSSEAIRDIVTIADDTFDSTEKRQIQAEANDELLPILIFRFHCRMSLISASSQSRVG